MAITQKLDLIEQNQCDFWIQCIRFILNQLKNLRQQFFVHKCSCYHPRPSWKKFLCDQNLELPLFLQPIFGKFFPSLEKFKKSMHCLSIYMKQICDRPYHKVVTLKNVAFLHLLSQLTFFTLIFPSIKFSPL